MQGTPLFPKTPLPGALHAAISAVALCHFNSKHGDAQDRHVYSGRMHRRLKRYLEPCRFSCSDTSITYHHSERYMTTFPVMNTNETIEQVAKHAVYNAERDTIEPIFKRLMCAKKDLPQALQRRVEALLDHMPDEARPKYNFHSYDKDHMCIFVQHALKKGLHIESYRDELSRYYNKKNTKDALGFFAEMLMFAGMGV